MKCSVFLGLSADGFIADEQGGVEWLESAGRKDVDMGSDSDMGFASFLSTVDCLIMGRKCMEKIASFNLSDEQWPYGDREIVVLSRTVHEVPENLEGRMRMHNGEIQDLLAELESQGYQSAYIDGGQTVRSFLDLALINNVTLSYAPVFIGSGVPLFGGVKRQITLYDAVAHSYSNDIIQVSYKLRYV